MRRRKARHHLPDSHGIAGQVVDGPQTQDETSQGAAAADEQEQLANEEKPAEDANPRHRPESARGRRYHGDRCSDREWKRVEAETLTVLTKQTSSANEDLGSLVKQLFAAAEPIQGKFNGAGRAAFDKFKGETDLSANELNSALAAVLGGIQGQNTAFVTGEQQMVDETTAAQGSANFESARFSGSR
jgi:uncharacterized protein YukE